LNENEGMMNIRMMKKPDVLIAKDMLMRILFSKPHALAWGYNVSIRPSAVV